MDSPLLPSGSAALLQCSPMPLLGKSAAAFDGLPSSIAYPRSGSSSECCCVESFDSLGSFDDGQASSMHCARTLTKACGLEPSGLGHADPLLGSACDGLACAEDLGLDDAEDDATIQYNWGEPPRTAARVHRPTAGYDHNEASEVIGNELRREAELKPCRSTARLSSDVRSKATSWMVEAATGLRLQPETLFAAVCHFDRFVANSEIMPPTNMLQLLALACVSLAAKQEEVPQYHISQWLHLAAGKDGKPLFTAEDLQKMEWLVLETLEWRLRVPTVFSFLQHFLHSLTSGQDVGAVPYDPSQRQTFVSCAHFLAELSLLFDSFLDYNYSTIAVACLVLSEWAAKGPSENGDWAPRSSVALQSVTALDLRYLRPCVEGLHDLYIKAASAPVEPTSVLAPVATRYTQPGCA